MYELDTPREVTLSAGERKPPQFDRKAYIKAVRHVYDKGGFTPEMLSDKPVAALRKETARCLVDAVDTTLMSDHVPEAMAEKLREDVFVFSGCKTYHELREASQLLVSDEGKVKSFHQFRQDVMELYPKYNEQYLEAEYEFAVSSAQSASRWADIMEDGDDYDLQYVTAGDSDVRPEHQALEGITLPPSDIFWSQYMPPNGWRCRCLANQVLRGKYHESDHDRALQLGELATTDNDSTGRNRAEMFRFNPGAQQIVFPPSHPYYHDAPQEARRI